MLYVANRRSDVQTHRIDGSAGGLSPVAGSPFPAGKGPTAIVMHSSGNFVYVANFNRTMWVLTASTIPMVLFCRSTFAILLGSGSDRDSGRSVRRFFTCHQRRSNDVSVFHVNQATGALLQVSNSPIFPPERCHAESRSILLDHLFISGIGPRMISAVIAWRGRRQAF